MSVIPFIGDKIGHCAVIPPSDVNISRLNTILDSAVIATEPDGDSLYICDGLAMPIWVHLNYGNKLVHFMTYHDTAEVDTTIGAVCANKLSGRLLLVQFHYVDHRLYGHYWHSYADGLQSRTLIRVARAFADICHRALNEDFTLFPRDAALEGGTSQLQLL